MTGLFPVAAALLLGVLLPPVFPILQFFFVRQEPSNIPNGTMGLPFLGGTFSYLTPHNSNSMGSFLEKHCSR
ncbi:hypothetical protein CsSME_00043603 [Camellia sinensis var. sinensis]